MHTRFANVFHWIAPALVIQAFGAFLYFVLFDKGITAGILYTFIKVTMLALPLIYVFSGNNLPAFFEKKMLWRRIPHGVMVGIAMAVLIMLAYAVFTYFGLLSNDVRAAVISKTESLGILRYYLPFAVFLSLAHSLFEEYYWRWFVFGGLRSSLSFNTAAIISSIGFSLHHFIILSSFVSLPLVLILGTVVGVAGYVWCVMYERMRSVIPLWISHALVDAAIMLIGWFMINSH